MSRRSHRPLNRKTNGFPATPLGDALRAATPEQCAELVASTGLDARSLLQRAGGRRCSLALWVRRAVSAALGTEKDVLPPLPDGWNRRPERE